jgi:hypothetical protein
MVDKIKRTAIIGHVGFVAPCGRGMTICDAFEPCNDLYA